MKKKKVAKWVAFILFSPCLLGMFYWLVMDFAMTSATSPIFDEMHQPGVRFLMKHGDKYAAYHLIDFMWKIPGYAYIEDHDRAVFVLAKRFPEEEDNYMAYTVSCILDKNTSIHGSYLLIWTLEHWTGENFGFFTEENEPSIPFFIEGGPMAPKKEVREELLAKARVNILNWWQKHQREQLAEYIPEAAQ